MSETISYESAYTYYEQTAQAVEPKVRNETYGPGNSVQEELQNRLAALDAVTDLVASNADVIVRCPWLGGAEVALGAAMNAYPTPMIEEDPAMIISTVLDLLANRVTEADEPETNEQDEEETAEAQKDEPTKKPPEKTKKEPTEQNRTAVQRTPTSIRRQFSPPKIAASKPEAIAKPPTVVRTTRESVAPSLVVKEQITKDKPAVQPQIEAVPQTAEKPVAVSPQVEAIQPTAKTQEVISPRAEVKPPAPRLKATELEISADSIITEQVLSETRFFAEEVDNLEASEPMLLEIGNAAISLATKIVPIEEDLVEPGVMYPIELTEKAPTLEILEQPIDVAAELSADFEPPELLIEHKQEYGADSEPIEIDIEAEFNASPELVYWAEEVPNIPEPVEILPSESIFVRADDIAADQVEETVIQLAQGIKDATPEVVAAINETLDKIIAVVAIEPEIEEGEAAAVETIIDDSEPQVELVEKWQFNTMVEQFIDQEDLIYGPQDPGTREAILKLLAGVSITQRIAANAYTIGSSTLKLSSVSLAA